MSDLFSATYNPDVLSCLANLSNDEVFTPPEVVNQMLDMLPEEIWSDKNATFLDPACKSGVFLREIAKRLIEAQLPDYEQISYEINEKLRAGGELDGRDIAFQSMLEDVIEHIFKNQVFGIAITELTSLLSRRSVYCSKYPQSEYSVVRFDNPEGRIDYKQMQHTWKNGKCVYCGASEGEYDREEGKEQYAYEFIHLDNPEEVFDMKFDVIIGNPPYQMSDGGGVGSSALPIYQRFIETAKRLNPRYLIMITPSRWFTGGRGLDSFREEMLNDRRIRIINDFVDASDCFPGVEIKGGVNYFLWSRDNPGDCLVNSHAGDKVVSSIERPLLEPGLETFVRNNNLISILRKVQSRNEKTFDQLVSANDPFGFDVREKGSYKRVKPSFSLIRTDDNPIALYYNGWRREGVGFVNPESIRKGQEYINCNKAFIPKAWGTGDPTTDWLKPFVPDVKSVCTETYLMMGPFETEQETENAISYTQTKFFHAMVSIVKITQNTMKKAYSKVPIQDFSKPWTDEELYEKYGITEEEQAYIDSLIKPMDLDD